MCGIRFNHEKFAHQCYYCGKLALQEELLFSNELGVWLCEECWDNKKKKDTQENVNIAKPE